MLPLQFVSNSYFFKILINPSERLYVTFTVEGRKFGTILSKQEYYKLKIKNIYEYNMPYIEVYDNTTGSTSFVYVPGIHIKIII